MGVMKKIFEEHGWEDGQLVLERYKKQNKKKKKKEVKIESKNGSS